MEGCKGRGGGSGGQLGMQVGKRGGRVGNGVGGADVETGESMARRGG